MGHLEKKISPAGWVNESYREKFTFGWTLKNEFKLGQEIGSSGRKMWPKGWRCIVLRVFQSSSI